MPLELQESPSQDLVSRRNFLRAGLTASALAVVPQSVQTLFAQPPQGRETKKEKVDVSKLSANEFLRALPEKIELPDGGVVVVEKCEVAGAERLLIIVRHLHKEDKELEQGVEALIRQSSKQNGALVRILREEWGVRGVSMEGFTREEADDLTALERKRTLTTSERKRLEEHRYELEVNLPEGLYDLYRNGLLNILPAETEAVHKAAMREKKERPDAVRSKITDSDREDECVKIHAECDAVISATIWGPGHWAPLPDRPDGALPKRVKRHNILNKLNDFSVMILTNPAVRDLEVLETKKKSR